MEYCLGNGLKLFSASTVLAVCQDSSVDFRRSLVSALRSSPKKEFGGGARARFPNSGWNFSNAVIAFVDRAEKRLRMSLIRAGKPENI